MNKTLALIAALGLVVAAPAFAAEEVKAEAVKAEKAAEHADKAAEHADKAAAKAVAKADKKLSETAPAAGEVKKEEGAK